jgi:hypothetical protein
VDFHFQVPVVILLDQTAVLLLSLPCPIRCSTAPVAQLLYYFCFTTPGRRAAKAFCSQAGERWISPHFDRRIVAAAQGPSQEKAPPMGRGKGGLRHWVGPSEGDNPARCIAYCWSARAPLPRLQSPFAARRRQQTSRMLQRAPNEVKSPASSKSIFWPAVAKIPRWSAKSEF